MPLSSDDMPVRLCLDRSGSVRLGPAVATARPGSGPPEGWPRGSWPGVGISSLRIDGKTSQHGRRRPHHPRTPVAVICRKMGPAIPRFWDHRSAEPECPRPLCCGWSGWKDRSEALVKRENNPHEDRTSGGNEHIEFCEKLL